MGRISNSNPYIGVILRRNNGCWIMVDLFNHRKDRDPLTRQCINCAFEDNCRAMRTGQWFPCDSVIFFEDVIYRYI